VLLAGRLFYILHDFNSLQIDPVAQGIDVIISGHSYMPNIASVDGMLYVKSHLEEDRRSHTSLLDSVPSGVASSISTTRSEPGWFS
jgi:hypothetical protein